ncbi:MAG: hypothetical protein AAF639_07685 [Chloroflexota bacterium]
MKNSYTFGECTRPKLEKWFGLRRALTSSVLDSWLQASVEITEQERIALQMFQSELILGHDALSEQELSMSFIGPILTMARFMEPYRFKLFSGRKIGTKVAGVDREVELSGEPDGMIATGYWEPEILMFAFSEYKKMLDPHGDPAGQALAAMLVGQTLNAEPIPLYGCYVIGHNWYFMVLEGKAYTISNSFSALGDEAFDIFRILKALRKIIEDYTLTEVASL